MGHDEAIIFEKTYGVLTPDLRKKKELAALCEQHFPEQYRCLQTIPGVKERTATAIIAETGTHMRQFLGRVQRQPVGIQWQVSLLTHTSGETFLPVVELLEQAG